MRGYGDQVACRITELVLDARDPELLARFWCEVLGYVELERVEGDIEIGPPGVGFGGPQPTIVFSQSDEPKAGKLRLHIDVNATDREQDDELERLLAAGARRVDIGQTGAEPWHVLADPEGLAPHLGHTHTAGRSGSASIGHFLPGRGASYAASASVAPVGAPTRCPVPGTRVLIPQGALLNAGRREAGQCAWTRPRPVT
jgi:Glyoxalase-like domain